MKLNSDKDILFRTNLTSSKGNQLKCKNHGRWYKADFLGYEGAAEYIASKILSQSNIKSYTTYSLSQIVIPRYAKEFKGCSSPDFLKEGCNLITADKLFKQNYSPNYLEQYKKMSLKDKITDFVKKIEEMTGIKEFGKQLTALLEFDAFIMNDDRHFNNIAFIENKDGTYEFAPVFDNGGGFLSDMTYDYPLNKSVHGLMSNVKAKPFDEDFDKQIEMCQRLYGSQFLVSKNLDISKELDNVKTLYGPEIAKRINDVVEHSKFMYLEFISDKDFVKDVIEKDLSIEKFELEIE